MWQPAPLWTKASTKLFFSLSFCPMKSLYHIGIAQLLAYYRTADLGDVMPPTFIRLPVSSVWIYNATWCWKDFIHHSSWRLRSRRLLRRLHSCFCLTFFDVVLVTSPHLPHPRMCLYYACVCIYMCVYIHTVYVYIYICSICNCGEKSANSPESSYVLALLYSFIFGCIPWCPTPWETLGDAKSCTSSAQLFVSWLKTLNQISRCWHER